MTETVHLEGMGVMGCLVAAHFHLEGIDFTWSDIDAPCTAWKVSTGAVPVFGDQQSHEDRLTWLRWYKERSDFQHHMTKAVWCYTAANPPHGARAVGCRVTEEVGPIKLTNKRSLHMDVQSFVKDTRAQFKGCQVHPGSWKNTIVTHGFGSNIGGWSWGWSAQVIIDMSAELLRALDRRRPCFYMRSGYQLPYLYPVGREREYYAGTTLVTQKAPKSLAIEPKLQNWIRRVEAQSGGHITVSQIINGTLGEGWRPMAAPDAPLIEKVDRRTLRIRPQYGNGIRHFPTTIKALLEAL